MFRFAVIVHLFAAGALTVYLTFFWQRESLSLLEHESRRICGMFSGCVPGTGSNFSTWTTTGTTRVVDLRAVCERYVIKQCHGALRCCIDCKAVAFTKARSLHLVDTLETQPTSLVVSFRDTHGSPVAASSIGCLVYFAIYVLLTVLRFLHNRELEKKRKDSRSKFESSHNKNKRLHVITGLLYIIGFVLVTSVTTFSVSYMARYWHLIKECQTTLLTLMSWNIVLFLFLIDYVFSAVPSVILSLTSKGLKGGKEKRKHTLSNRIFNAIAGLALLWWILIGIYLEGVYSGKWTLYL